MSSMAYAKRTVASNFKIWLLFTVVICVFLTAMCNVFTPTNMKEISSIAADTLMGNLLTGTTMIGFMGNFFYAVMAIIFPMIFSILVGNKLIAVQVDRGSMAGFLSTPTSRNQITITSALYIIVSLMLMWLVITIVGITVANAVQPGQLDVSKFITINVGALLYHLSISSICFISSCIFNSSSKSLMIGCGVIVSFICMGAIAVVLYVSGIVIFNKKDLPI